MMLRQIASLRKSNIIAAPLKYDRFYPINQQEIYLVSPNVPPPWKITYNTLGNLEPSDVDLAPDRDTVFAHWFTQDLMQITNEKAEKLIDVGWYPDGEAKGEFKIEVIKRIGEDDFDWSNPLLQFRTRSLANLLKKIEAICQGD